MYLTKEVKAKFSQNTVKTALTQDLLKANRVYHIQNQPPY